MPRKVYNTVEEPEVEIDEEEGDIEVEEEEDELLEDDDEDKDYAELEAKATEASDDDEAAFLASLEDEVDAAEIANKEKRIYLEKGIYYWKEPPTIKGRYLSNDKRRTDRVPDKGREIWDIHGAVIHSALKSEEYFRFSLSPDERTITNGERKGKPDGFSQNYAKVTAYYRKKMAKTHENHKALYDFLKKGDYAFYVSQTSSGNYLGNFQDKK